MPSDDRAIGRRSWAVWLSAALMWLAPSDTALAHEGHAALPSKGASVRGDQLLLTAAAEKALGLKVAEAVRQPMSRSIEVNARVELPWDRRQVVGSLIGGRLQAVLVRPGEPVSAGQELARLESLELENLQLDLLQADTQVQLARRLVQQQRGLAQRGVVAGRQLVEAEGNLRQALARRELARLQLQALGTSVAEVDEVLRSQEVRPWLSVHSPMDGWVQTAALRAGQVVQPTDVLFELVDNRQVWLVGEVLEADLAGIGPGTAAEAWFDLPDQSPIPGRVDHLRQTVDPRRHTVEVVVRVDNDGRLRPGMFGRMRLAGERREGAVTVPAAAVVHSSGGPFVLIQTGRGSFVRRPVQTGVQVAGRVEILGGVFPADRVVMRGNQLLGALFGDSAGMSPEPAPARVVEPSMSASARPLTALGVVEVPASQQSRLSVRAEGRLVRLHVSAGQHVRRGEVVAEIDSLELRRQQLALLQARAAMDAVRQRLERLQQADEVAARRQVWEVETELATLEAEAESARRRLKQLGLAEADLAAVERADPASASMADLPGRLMLRAVSDGTVAQLHVQVGQVVAPLEPILTVQDTSRVWVQAHLFQHDAPRVRVGQPAAVQPVALGGESIPAQVARLAPALEDGRLLRVWLEMDNPQGRLLPGMSATVTFPPAEPALVRDGSKISAGD